MGSLLLGSSWVLLRLALTLGASTSLACTSSTPHHIRDATALSFPTRWYKRSEAQKRFTFFIACTTLGGAFGGLLSYAIAGMDGKAGLGSWQWVFIIGLSVFPLPAVGH